MPPQPGPRLLEENGSNYVFWCHRVQTVLELRDLWPTVDGTDPKPDPTLSLDRYSEWLRRDREARAQITLTLKDECLNSVLAVKTAKDSIN